MKILKKSLAFILSIAMLLSLVPVALAVNRDYGAKLVGVSGPIGTGSVNGVTFTLQLKGTEIGTNGTNIILRVDTTKLYPVRISNGEQLPQQLTHKGKLETAGLSPAPMPGAVASYCDGIGFDEDEGTGYLTSKNIFYLLDEDANALYLSLQPSANNVVNAWTDYTAVINFALGYVGTTTEADLDMTTVRLVTPEEAGHLGQNAVAAIQTGTDPIQYGLSNLGSGDNNLEKPEIIYPNSDAMNLNGVKLDAAQRYANVPVSLPTTGADVTVATTPTAYYSAAMEDGTEITSGVTYTYGLQIKEDAGNRDLTDAEKAAISIGTDGVVTIKAGAPEAVVVITATGSYTNTKNSVSTASGTFELNLRHGDAGKKNEEDPTLPKKEEPKKENDVTKAAAGVAIYKGDAQVTSSVAGATAHKETIAVPESADTTLTFTGKVFDQYGDEYTAATGTWNDDALTSATGITFSNGTVTVTPTATKDTYNYTYTSGAYSATVEITVADNAVTWPTLTNDTIVYGQTDAELTFNNDGAVTGKGTIDNIVFSWKAGQTFAAGTTKAVMQCSYTVDGIAAPTAENEYDITVNKADQEIVTDVDADINNGVLQIAIDDSVKLNTSVNNGSVAGADNSDTGAVTYELTDVNGLVTLSGDEITGEKLSSENGNALATLKITAAGTANYNEATREIKVRVTLPVLAAQITFDTTAPKFGQEITATITAADDQPNSVTADVDYTWGHIVADGEGKTKFEPITTGNSEGKLTNANGSVATVTYTPVKEDITQILALKVTTPTEVAGYGYIHSVQGRIEAPVAKATWGGYGVTVKGTTYNSITVTGAEHAKFAIAPKNAPAAVDEAAGGVTDTHTWVNGYDETGAKDVVFTKSDGDVDLLPNTEYTVYMKMEATDTHEESAVLTSAAKTKQPTVTPTPNPEDPDNPIPPDISGITVTAAIDETAGLKFDATLTASVTVTDSNNPAKVDVDKDFDWSYQWVRVTPVEGGTNTEEDISGATAATYKLAEEDIGKIIKVKVTTTDASKYAAVAETQTTDVIDLADGPDFTNTLGMEEATNATSTDGKITGLDNGKEYEITKKPDGEFDPDTLAWSLKTSSAAGKIEDVGADTYLVRIPATTTHEASAYKEITVEVNGHNISGVVVSYNAKNAVTYELYAWDNETSAYAATATYTGTAIEGTTELPSGRQTQTFTIEGIADGTYKLRIKKDYHLTITINNVTVNGDDLDLTATTMPAAVQSITMVPGDIDRNGAVNSTDLGLITNTANYNKVNAADARNPEADIDGNGSINSADKGIITNVNHYNKMERQFEYTIS